MEPEQHKKIQENFHLIEEIVLETIKKSEEKKAKMTHHLNTKLDTFMKFMNIHRILVMQKRSS